MRITTGGLPLGLWFAGMVAYFLQWCHFLGSFLHPQFVTFLALDKSNC